MKKIDWKEVWKESKKHGNIEFEHKAAFWVLGIFMAFCYLTVFF